MPMRITAALEQSRAAVRRLNAITAGTTEWRDANPEVVLAKADHFEIVNQSRRRSRKNGVVSVRPGEATQRHPG
jgi:hypothetical protein